MVGRSYPRWLGNSPGALSALLTILVITIPILLTITSIRLLTLRYTFIALLLLGALITLYIPPLHLLSQLLSLPLLPLGVLLVFAVPSILSSLAVNYFAAGDPPSVLGSITALAIYLQAVLLWSQTELWMWHGELQYEPLLRVEPKGSTGSEVSLSLCNRSRNTAYSVLTYFVLEALYIKPIDFPFSVDLGPDDCVDMFIVDVQKLRGFMWSGSPK